MIEIKNIKSEEIKDWVSFHRKNNVKDEKIIDGGKYSIAGYSKIEDFYYDLEDIELFLKGFYINGKLSAAMIIDGINEEYYNRTYQKDEKDDFIMSFEYLIFNPSENWNNIFSEMIKYFQNKNEFGIDFSSLMDHHIWFQNTLNNFNCERIQFYNKSNNKIFRYFIPLSREETAVTYDSKLLLSVYSNDKFDDTIKEHETGCCISSKIDELIYLENKKEKKYKIRRKYIIFEKPLIIKKTIDNPLYDNENERLEKRLPIDDIYFDIEINGKKYEGDGYSYFKKLNKLTTLFKYTHLYKIIYGFVIYIDFDIKINRKIDIKNNIIRSAFIHDVEINFSNWINSNFECKGNFKKTYFNYKNIQGDITPLKIGEYTSDIIIEDIKYLENNAITYENNLGWIYLVQPEELLNTNRFKIGITQQKNAFTRPKSYGKKSRWLIIYEINNARNLEKKIKEELNKTFICIKGEEYFEGNEKEIRRIFFEKCIEYSSN